jgi:hypothetical protein
VRIFRIRDKLTREFCCYPGTKTLMQTSESFIAECFVDDLAQSGIEAEIEQATVTLPAEVEKDFKRIMG